MSTRDTRCTNQNCTNKRCVGCIAFAPMNTPDTEWEKEFDELFTMEWDKHASWQDFGNAVSPEQVRTFIATLLTSRDTYWKERVRKERARCFQIFLEEAEKAGVQASYPMWFERLKTLDTLLDNLK